MGRSRTPTKHIDQTATDRIVDVMRAPGIRRRFAVFEHRCAAAMAAAVVLAPQR